MTSWAVQWLRFCVSNAGLIPGQGTKIPHTERKKKWQKHHQPLFQQGEQSRYEGAQSP